MKITYTVIFVVALLVIAAGLVLADGNRSAGTGSAELERLISDGRAGEDYLLVDVRTDGEFRGGHIPTAINIDHREIGRGMEGVDRDMPVILYCRSGARSSTAYRVLQEMGFTDLTDFGGIRNWKGDLER
jgi:phage shock protein E